MRQCESARRTRFRCLHRTTCLTYEECLAIRRNTNHPFVLDENVDGLDMLLRAKADLAMDVVNLKISKLAD